MMNGECYAMYAYLTVLIDDLANIVITQADKGGKVVILDCDDYRKKLFHIFYLCHTCMAYQKFTNLVANPLRPIVSSTCSVSYS